jgi:hypothetical protein
LNQDLLQIGNEPRREGTLLDPRERLLGRYHVVEDLSDLDGKLRAVVDVGLEDILERGECALQGACALGLSTERWMA